MAQGVSSILGGVFFRAREKYLYVQYRRAIAYKNIGSTKMAIPPQTIAFNAHREGLGPRKVFKGKGACDRAKEWARLHGYIMLAYDVTDTGAKNYMVTNWHDIYTFREDGVALSFPRIARNYLYEGLFPERPCVPFFDLDGETEHNDGLLDNLDERTRTSMDIIRMTMKATCDKDVSRRDFIILDASSDKKASRHLIIRKEGVYFKNMYEHAKFSSVVRDRIMTACAMEDHPNLERLLRIRKKEKNKPMTAVPFVDLCVYKNHLQLFRILGCTKRGHNRPLKVAAMCRHRLVQSGADERAVFLGSLISRVLGKQSDGIAVDEKLIGPEGIVCYGGNALTGAKKKRRKKKRKRKQQPTATTPKKRSRTSINRSDQVYVAVEEYLKSNTALRPWTEGRFYLYRCRHEEPGRKALYLISPRTRKVCPLLVRRCGREEHDNGVPFATIWCSGRVFVKCHSSHCNEDCMEMTLLTRGQIQRLWP